MCHDDKIACIAGKDTVEPVKYGGKSYDEWVRFSVYFTLLAHNTLHLTVSSLSSPKTISGRRKNKSSGA